MKRPVLLTLSLFLIAGISVGLFWLKNSASAETAEIEESHPLEAVNTKARNARTGDLSAAQEYVGEIISVTGFGTELRGYAADSIKDRVGRAESEYRLGRTSGVPETKIARTVNGLAAKFELPDYAKTTAYEVRKLRLSLLPSYSQIIAQKTRGSQPVSAGAWLDAEMSPAEAYFVLSVLMQQKLLNEDYQLTTAENSERWAETHNHRPDRETRTSPHPAEGRSSEIAAALRNGYLASPDSPSQLINLTLNTLGIEQ